MMHEISDYYSVKEFAKLLKVHPNTIRNAIKTGHINAFRVGISIKSSYRIPHTEIHKLAIMEWEGIISRIAKVKEE